MSNITATDLSIRIAEAVAKANSSAEIKIEKAARPRPAPPAISSTLQPSDLVEKPSQAPLATPPVTDPLRGSAAYYVPKQMMESIPSMVDLWIARTTPIEQLKQELAAQLKINYASIDGQRVQNADERSGMLVSAQFDGVSIPIGTNMVAQLRGGNDFSIDPEGPIRWSLPDEGIAKWNWRVTPKRVSTGTFITLDIWIDEGSGRPWKDSYHKPVIVNAIPLPWYEKLYKITQELNALLTLFGIGGIGGLLAWLFSKRKRNMDDDHAEPNL